MSNTKQRKPRDHSLLNRDRARPLNVPAPSSQAVEERLRELVAPATYSLVGYYHRLGLRERVLTLPITVALILAMIWRQIPSVAEMVRTLAREELLWAPPMAATEQAFNQRLRCLPPELFAALFHRLLPGLLERSRARSRPLPPALARALARFGRIWAMDASTLEEVCRKTGLLQDGTKTVLGGKILALLDLPSKLPAHLWYEADPDANENGFLDRVKAVLGAGTLLIMDRGFHGFAFFDYLTEAGSFFITRARSNSAFRVSSVLQESPLLRDRIVALGQHRSCPCRHPVRRIEVLVGGAWQAYLTNVTDPQTLSAADVVELYGRRWKIEEAFLLVKRLLGLSYLWSGAANALALQVWSTWLLHATLVDLSDAVAQELDLPLDRISIEMVYRGLYHFTVACSRGQAHDPVAYLVSQPDLGIVKRSRKHRPRQALDITPGGLKL